MTYVPSINIILSQTTLILFYPLVYTSTANEPIDAKSVKAIMNYPKSKRFLCSIILLLLIILI